MAEATAIGWTDSTFNPWIGCTRVGPGCDHCYAEALDRRHKWGGRTHWGSGKRRMRTSPTYWKQPILWDSIAERTHRQRRVFCASLADVFDNEVDPDWRRDLFALIARTPNLTWQILTKRIGNAEKMLPPNWGVGYQNVWIGATMVNQEEVDRDLAKLIGLPAMLRFVSYEPALGPVELSPGLEIEPDRNWTWRAKTKFGGDSRIGWVIVGGESGPGRRQLDMKWLSSVVEQCRAATVPVFVKQDSGPRSGDQGRIPKALWVHEFPPT